MIYEIMKARRSVRCFKSDVPDRALVLRLIEAAITAPSASNGQPWRFLIVTRREAIDHLAQAVRAAVDRIATHVEPACEASFRAYGEYFTRFEHAPVVIVPLFRGLTILSNMVGEALPDDDRARIAAMERDSGVIGTSLALQNLLLMAHELGMGASGMTGPLVASDRIREILDVPPSWDVLALVPIGFPDEEPRAPERRPTDRVMRWIE